MIDQKLMEMDIPGIFLFNPTCEYATANGHVSWQPNRLLQKMEEDLGTLPLFFARPADIVLVRKIPPANFLASLKKIGIDTPGWALINDIASLSDLGNKSGFRLSPWGWSPATHRLLHPLIDCCPDDLKNLAMTYKTVEYREICSRKFALGILKSLLLQLPAEKVLPPHMIPEIVRNKTEIQNSLQRWKKIVVKAPWSTSGRGLQYVTKTPVVEKVWEKLLGIIKDQGYALAEPLLEKEMDMGLQFKIRNGIICYLGVSRFLTDTKGQYKGNYLNGWAQEADLKTVEFAESLPQLIVGPLIKVLESSPMTGQYNGNFGVDLLIFRDEMGILRVNPCLEINVRQTMGQLALIVEKHISPDKKGMFKLFYQPGKSFLEFSIEMGKMYPVEINDSQVNRGFFPVTPPLPEAAFGAYILVI